MSSALALPTEAHHSSKIKGLPRSLGKAAPIDPQGLLGGDPKPNGPPYRSASPAATPVGSRAAVLAALPKHLRLLSREVERLKVGNPEAFAIAKSGVAAALNSFAVLIEIEGAGP